MKEKNWELLAKYFSGELSSPEKEEFLHWLNSDPKNQSICNSTKELWDQFDTQNISEEKEFDSEAEWKKLSQAIHQNSGSKTLTMYVKEQPWPLIAAATIVISLLGIVFYKSLNSETIPTHTEVAVKTEVPAGIHQNTIHTVNDSTYSYTFPDGSQVILNENSSIVFFDDFKENRTVELNGEAYFNVLHDPTHPFTVVCGNIEVLDIGTKFNINSYKIKEHIKIFVHEGEVQVSDKENQKLKVNLKENEGINYNNHNKKSIKTKSGKSYSLWWKERKKESKIRRIIRKIINKIRRKKNK